MDLMASLAKLVGTEESSTDSKEFLDVLMGTSDTARESLVIEATSRTALRMGDWIMIPSYKGPAINKETNIELGNSEEYQLYNLKEDIGQQNNLAKSNPEKLKEMFNAFVAIRGEGFEKTEKLELH
jgi:arylsulfatase A-like enzyme